MLGQVYEKMSSETYPLHEEYAEISVKYYAKALQILRDTVGVCFSFFLSSLLFSSLSSLSFSISLSLIHTHTYTHTHTHTHTILSFLNNSHHIPKWESLFTIWQEWKSEETTLCMQMFFSKKLSRSLPKGKGKGRDTWMRWKGMSVFWKRQRKCLLRKSLSMSGTLCVAFSLCLSFLISFFLSFSFSLFLSLCLYTHIKSMEKFTSHIEKLQHGQHFPPSPHSHRVLVPEKWRDLFAQKEESKEADANGRGETVREEAKGVVASLREEKDFPSSPPPPSAPPPPSSAPPPPSPVCLFFLSSLFFIFLKLFLSFSLFVCVCVCVCVCLGRNGKKTHLHHN